VKAWSEWEIIRRQVAIGGRVVDENNNPVAGVLVTITSMPKGFKQSVEAAFDAVGAQWDDQEERQDRARSRLDGIYFFLDLPEGKYTLKAIDLQSGEQDEKSVSISRDKKQNIKMTQADFRISAE
jgi:hypothetical protein